MSHIKSIHSNVKKGINVENVGKYNLLVGPNGSGKTSLINSIELALGGFVSDLNGKDVVKKAGDLISLSNDGKELKSTISFEDSTEASYTLKATARGAGRPKHVCKKTVRFPFQEVKEGLAGSADKVKKWLMENVLGVVGAEQVIAGFPASLQELYREASQALRSAKPKYSEIDILLAVTEAQKEQAKVLKAEIKTLTETTEEWKGGLTVKPSQAEVDALKEASDRTNVDLASFIAENDRMQNTLAPDEVEIAFRHARQLAVQLQSAEEKKQKLQGLDIQSLSELETLTHKLYTRSNDIVRASQFLGLERCSVCRSYVTKEEWDGHSQHLLALNSELEKKKKIFDLWVKLNEEISQLQIQSIAAAKDWKHLTQIKIEPFDQEGYDRLVKMRDDRGHALMAAMHTIAAWEDVVKLEEKVSRKKSELKEVNKVVRAAKRVNDTLVNDAIHSFCSRVDKYLNGDSFHLEIGATSVKYGLVRSDAKAAEFVTALSGAESLRVTFAIACALNDQDEALNIYIPEDRSLTSSTLASLITSLSNVDGQVFLTSTFPIDLPADWTLIEMPQQDN